MEVFRQLYDLFFFSLRKIIGQVQPGVEPGTSRVWSERDNHYTIEPSYLNLAPRIQYTQLNIV